MTTRTRSISDLRPPSSDGPILDVRDLVVEFPLEGGSARAVDGVSLHIRPGEILGVVGESGSGKSMTALSIIRLVPAPGRIAGGQILFEGNDVREMPEAELRRVRGGRIGMVFQDPLSSLNPVLTIGFQVAEAIATHQRVGRGEAWRRAVSMLERVRLPDPAMKARQYPHQLSGGQRQRVGIAIAFSCDPPLVIADEPTTALDVTVQKQVLALMTGLARDTGTAIMLITHDLGVVAETCDRVAVMYAGRIVESGPATQIFDAPRHPYTRALLASLTRLDEPLDETGRRGRSSPGGDGGAASWPRSGQRRGTVPGGEQEAETGREGPAPLPSIAGQPPDLRSIPPGCPFHPRCPDVMPRCREEMPGETRFADDSFARCWLLEPPE